MRSFMGPNTTNFKSDIEMTNETPNVEEYLALAAPMTEKSRKACDEYIAKHFGVAGTDGFKEKELMAFTEEAMAASIKKDAEKEDKNEAVTD